MRWIGPHAPGRLWRRSTTTSDRYPSDKEDNHGTSNAGHSWGPGGLKHHRNRHARDDVFTSAFLGALVRRRESACWGATSKYVSRWDVTCAYRLSVRE